jgi:uncharacterized protein (TIGR03435 family)
MPGRVRASSIPVVLLLALNSGVDGQEPNRFEAADVHVSPDTPLPYPRGGLTGRGTYELRFATMVDLISIAENVPTAKVLGGPGWLEWDRFDVVAKIPAGATLDTVRTMLRALLAERFKLVVHNDTQPMPSFILMAGPKVLMKPSRGTEESGCKPDGPRGGLIARPDAAPVFSFTCRNLTMQEFAAGMPRMSGVLGYTNNLPIVDRTGLKGAWNFNLKYTVQGGETRYGVVPSAGDLVTLPAALSRQLGLELKSGKTPTPVLVVDGVNETPTPNPPGTMAALPTAPTEFDVADLKPSDPASSAFKFQIQNGRVNIQGSPLSALIYRAWNVNNPDQIAGMPAWADTARFDIVAKSSSPGPDPLPQPGVKAGYDATIAMLRRLLTDRFGIKMHEEDRPVSAFTLLRGKPKLKKADPGSRTSCTEFPGPDEKDPRLANPAITRLLNCTNVTMAQFGKLLPVNADDYVQSPVLDKTGLEGGYDFTLYFSDAALVGADSRSSDPNGGISLAEAIDKQLGLKLELQKRPAKVLIIDHIDQTPAAN